MIASHPIADSLSSQLTKPHSRLGHLLSAAVISPHFQRMLLEDPKTALQSGYLGGTFELSTEEQECILSAKAESLADLAKKTDAIHNKVNEQ